MAKKKLIDVKFPLGGLNRRGAHRQQPPYTSRDLLNVRPKGSLQGRERGGSRPGLIESHLDSLGAAVRLLHPMVLALGDGFTAWSDTFSGAAMADAWTQATWASDIPSILPSSLAGVDTSVAEGEVTLDTLPIDTAQAYTVEMFLTPWAGAFSGKYRIYLRLDDATPNYLDAGVMVELWFARGADTGLGKIQTLTGGGAHTNNSFTFDIPTIPTPGWLSATVVGDLVTVYWNGVVAKSATVDSHPGAGVGFGLQTIQDDELTLVNTFRVQYYSTGTVDVLRSMLIASAGGDLWRETTYGRMTVVTSDLTVRTDVPMTSAQSAQKLYIADYGDTRDSGTDGTVSGSVLDDVAAQDWSTLGIDPDSDVCVINNVGGATVAGTYNILSVHATNGVTLDSAPGDGTCAYRIERAPKIYNPLLNTIAIMTATAGQVPTGNPLIARYLDRIVVAGAEIAPHVWYMSRQGDPLDWDYAQTDSQRAIAGLASEAGVPGTAITALIAHSDDYLIMGCRSELWRLRGDPAFGGQLDSLSDTVGIIGQSAWTLGPAGELIFLSLDGIYILAPGGSSYPKSMSRELLPREFLNLDPNTVTASLEYDINGRGVHIYLTPDSSNARTHWWLDWDRKTFWPVSYSSGYEPTATCAVQGETIEDSGVILGGRDGTLRRHSDLASSDSGTAFTTYVVIGPFALGKDGMTGSILTMSAEIALNSGDVTWATYPALTFEGTESASVSDTGTFIAGLNASVRPGCRGQAATIKLTGETARSWSLEQIIATVKPTGRRRIS